MVYYEDMSFNGPNYIIKEGCYSLYLNSPACGSVVLISTPLPSIGSGKRQHTWPFFSAEVQSNLNLKQYFGAYFGFAPITSFMCTRRNTPNKTRMIFFIADFKNMLLFKEPG